MSNLKRLARQTFRKYQRLQDVQTAILGDPDTKAVDVPGRPPYDYCQVQGQVVQVYNRRVPSQYGLKVKIGFDPSEPRLQQVLSIASAPVSSASSSGGSQGVGPHAETHRWLGSGPGGGQDWLPVELRQFMPLRIAPAGGLSILIYRGVLWLGGAPAAQDFETVDLTSYVPATAGNALFALITIDDTGAIVITTGSEVAIVSLALSDIPAVPAGTAFVLGAVRLYEGQTEIVEARTTTDIVDLRFPQYWVSGGGGGGGGLDDLGMQSLFARPAVVNAEDDLFDGSSLDAKWTVWASGAGNFTDLPGWLHVTGGGFTQPIPAGDMYCEIEILTGDMDSTPNYYTCGLFIAANNDSTGLNAFFRLGMENNLHQYYFGVEKDNGSSYVSNYDNWSNFAATNDHIFLRASRVGTTWTFLWSTNGKTFRRLYQASEATLGFTPAYMGFRMGGATLFVNYFIRR